MKRLKRLEQSFTNGDEVGIGADGEPLLRNIKIMEQLPYNYFAYEK